MKNTNLIIGKTNTGKTKGVLFNQVTKLIENSENIFIMDQRGEYYKTFGETLKENNYDIKIVNFNNTLKSNGYNPLMLPYKLYKDNKKDDAIQLIHDFAYEICKEKSQVDPFWTNSAADYITGLILIMLKNAKEEEINIGSLTMMLNQSQMKKNDTTYLNEYLSKINLLEDVYITLSGTAFAPYETQASILSVAKQKLNSIAMKENLISMLSTNDIDFTNIKEKTAIFVEGKSDIANIILDQLYYVIKNDNLSFNFIIDGIANYSNVLSLEDIIKNATYNNIKLFITTISIEELNENYGKNFENKFENIINAPTNENLIEYGTYNDYPKLKNEDKKYFNFIEFLEK